MLQIFKQKKKIENKYTACRRQVEIQCAMEENGQNRMDPKKKRIIKKEKMFFESKTKQICG